ncbi:hypothetical protein SK128_016724, partial [Halocaridina rubra]
MEVRSPQTSFSTSKGQSLNYKKFFIDVYNKEENLQQQPQSPQVSKPMPDLVPLPDDVLVHPKKRLKRECDDPVLGEAAASPMSSVVPYSPMSVIARFGEGDDKVLKAPAVDGRLSFGSDFPFSSPNSPFTNLASPLDLTSISDSAFSPLRYPFSPDSLTQDNFPADLFSSKAPVALSNSQLPPRDMPNPRSPHKERLEPPHPKPCYRPQSTALDLTSMPGHFTPENQFYHQHQQSYLHPAFRHHHPEPLNNHPPLPSCSVAPATSENYQCSVAKRGFQAVGSNSGISHQTGHPRLIPQTFDRPTGIVPPFVRNQPLHSAHTTLVPPYHPKQLSLPGPTGGIGVGGGPVGVIRPKPQFYRGPIPHPYFSQPGQLQGLQSPP